MVGEDLPEEVIHSVQSEELVDDVSAQEDIVFMPPDAQMMTRPHCNSGEPSMITMWTDGEEEERKY